MAEIRIPSPEIRIPGPGFGYPVPKFDTTYGSSISNFMLNPRLPKGVVTIPKRFVADCTKKENKVTPGI